MARSCTRRAPAASASATSEPVPAERPWPASGFWDWSLAAYARPGVAPACLALQDRPGLDVNLLLFAVRAGTPGRALPPDALRAAVDRAARWPAEVVRQLPAPPTGSTPGG